MSLSLEHRLPFPLDTNPSILGLSSMMLFEDASPDPSSSNRRRSIESLWDRSARGSEMLLHPEARANSHEQVMEKENNYHAGLVMALAKCIDVDETPYNVTTQEDFSDTLEARDDQRFPQGELHERPSRDHHYSPPSSPNLIDRSTPKTITVNSSTASAWKPRIMSTFEDMGVILTFIIIRSFGDPSRRTAVEKGE